MKTNKLDHLNAVVKTVIFASTILMAVSLLGLLYSGTGDGKNVSSSNNTPKINDITTRSVQQTQDRLGNFMPSGIPLSTPAINNGGTGYLAETPSMSTGSSARPSESPVPSKPPVTKSTRTKLMALPLAENQLYTSDNRLFVTGSNGIFEIVTGPNGSTSAIEREPKRNCDFQGIAEVSGVLYVNCATFNIPYIASYVYAAVLNANPSFKRIYTYKSAMLPNGMTADNSGNLYVANLFGDQILRLTPSVADPLSFAKTGVWLKGTGLTTDGIKFRNNSIYWTNGQLLNRVEIRTDGTPGRQTRVLSGTPTFFDDFIIDDNGILVADHVYGVIRKYDLNGRSTGTIGGFYGPSSIAWARAPFPIGSLIVTERVSNQVTLFTP